MSPPPFGGLFRKKEKKKTAAIKETDKVDDEDTFSSSLITKRNGSSTKESNNSLTISQGLTILHNIENEKVSILSSELSPIKDSLENALFSIGKLADDLYNEKIKVEEERFKPSVEHARKIVVSSLRREASSEIPLPVSIQEAKKFQQKLESMMERFGEVSGSHSKVLNAFMKKHAGRLKGALETISSLQRRTKKIIEDFEEEIMPVGDCINLLGRTSQMADYIQSKQHELDNINREILKLESEHVELAGRLKIMENSSDFETSAAIIHQIELAQKEEQEFRKQLLDLFSHISRALTKYSYGLSKETTFKLQILMHEPWKVYESENSLNSYTSLLVDVHKAINNGKITLKDSEKVQKYFESIINSLPEFNKRSQRICTKLQSLEERKDNTVLNLSEDLKNKLRAHESSIENNKLYVEKLQNEIREKKGNLENTIRDSEECLFSLTGKNYTLYTSVNWGI